SQEPQPLAVKAVPAVKGDLVISLKSPGEAFTNRLIAVKAEVSGVVKSLNVAEGRHVREGDLLIEIDDREYRLRLEKQQALRLKYLSEMLLEKQFGAPDVNLSAEAQAKIAKAKADLEKAGELFAKGLLSGQELEKAQRDCELVLIETGAKKDEIMASAKNLTQAEIDVKIAELELDKTRIRAPFSGIITAIKVSPKEHVATGRELFTLVNIAEIKIRAKVLESEIGKMKVGREVDVRFSAYPGKVFKGTVDAISPVVNADDKTCAVQVAVGNPAEEIKPGMHAEVEIAAEIHQGRLIVPQDAILVRGGRKLVFVVEGDLAKWRYVEVGVENEEFAEILDGVKEGELVITEGHFTLAHDARVAVKN
ncbi:MAG: efflux RND transporter periplasmic adaptor subunit, partial [Candidatus Aminicenantes bacterium]|nr:efflux RND transporter periplasmic adaptor subunit [Candidatus Aminicenantes bacterium]